MKKPRFSRRQLFVLATGAAMVFGARQGRQRLSRAADPSSPLSEGAKELIREAWKGLDPAKVLDCHVHVVGLGVGGTGCYVSERMTSLSSPLEYLKFSVYETAAGIANLEMADAEYAARLLSLAKEAGGRFLLFPFDQCHDDDGKPLREESEFYTPNDYVLQLAKKSPEVFVPAASIHPYRADAVSELTRCVEQGAVAVKWLPNAMNIDPSSAKCDAFYGALARLRVPLITHAGEEKAVHAEERQRLGNPLHLRRPLEQGVTVVVAHCASLGQNPDLDAAPLADGTRPWADNFDLFVRLMGEERWKGKLFGELSATTIVNRIGKPIRTILGDAALQERLVNGSDYPLPAINVLMQTGAIESQGFITGEQRRLLNEIDQHNPLLLDFVIKRTMRLHKDGAQLKLAESIFEVRPEVFSRLGQ